MRNILFLFLSIAFLANAQDKLSVKMTCDKKNSSITYSMNHPLHAWSGVNKNVTAIILTDEKKEMITNVAVSAKIAEFDSQNANRDSHTIEVTEAIKYPAITFASTSIEQSGNQLKVTGKLTFHGITQPLTFDSTKELVNGKIVVKGKFNVTMTQFKIDPPTLMGIATDDDIAIEFDVEF
jgi:polyisoprenoid-binding protein YceI